MTDTAGPAVVNVLRQQWPDARIETSMVADEQETITTRLVDWARAGVDLIITVGGTGLSQRDRTPEATQQVIDRYVPGIGEAMRSLGAEKNPYAWLSRGIAGMRGTTLIINLPGSKRGAEESLAAIQALLRHALDVARGTQTHP